MFANGDNYLKQLIKYIKTHDNRGDNTIKKAIENRFL